MENMNKLSDEELEQVYGGAKEEEPPREDLIDEAGICGGNIHMIRPRIWICPICKARNPGGDNLTCKNCGYRKG